MAAISTVRNIKVSKNRKKYWRKHVNLEDVEEYLEDKRQDEKFGGPVDEKPDDQLFLFATKKKLSPDKLPRQSLPQLRCFQILQINSAVPAPMKPPQLQSEGIRSAKTPARWINDKNKKTKRFRQGPKTIKRSIQGLETPQEPYDLWTTENKKEALSKGEEKLNIDMSFIPEIVTKKDVKVPEYRYQKPSLLPAVEPPHPGASYNPTNTDYQDLLRMAHETEVKWQKKEDHIHRTLTLKFPKKLPSKASYLKEMSAGLGIDSDLEDEEEQEEDTVPTGPKSWGQPISFQNYKNKAARNLDKVRKREQRKVMLEKILKRRLNDFQRLKCFKKELNKAELMSKERQKKREVQRGESMFKPKRIGRIKYEAPDLEVKLGDELPDSLRRLKGEGHLLEERYKSFQRRNILEPRQPQSIKKKWTKAYVKRSHRD